MNQVPNELFDKYLKGDISDKGAGQLSNWLREDSSHMQIFNEYKQNWYLEEGVNFSLDGAFNKIKAKLNQDESYDRKLIFKKKGKKLVLNIIKVAAILIIGVFLDVLLKTYMHRDAGTQWYTVSAANGQKSKIELADGTEVWLNSQSSLRIPSNGFSKKVRNVELSGEAFFKVAHNDKVPFVVKTKDYDIEVLGTEFNVMAYEDFKRTETSLVNGSVRISRDGNELILKPGQTAIYSKNGFSLEKGKIEQSVCWKDNKFYFDAIPFHELVTRLERWYDVEIEIGDNNLKNKLYSGVFKNEETIWQVLDVIELTSPISYERTGFRKIEIENKK